MPTPREVWHLFTCFYRQFIYYSIYIATCLRWIKVIHSKTADRAISFNNSNQICLSQNTFPPALIKKTNKTHKTRKTIWIWVKQTWTKQQFNNRNHSIMWVRAKDVRSSHILTYSVRARYLSACRIQNLNLLKCEQKPYFCERAQKSSCVEYTTARLPSISSIWILKLPPATIQLNSNGSNVSQCITLNVNAKMLETTFKSAPHIFAFDLVPSFKCNCRNNKNHFMFNVPTISR